MATDGWLGVGRVFDGTRLADGDVQVVQGRITELRWGPGRPAGDPGLLAMPGLVDLQVNGFAGIDLQTAGDEQWQRVGQAVAATGVTAYLPTLISAAPEQLLDGVARAARVCGRGRLAEERSDGPPAARALGVHLEGPFLSALWPGAHPVDQLRPVDLDLAQALLAAGPVQHVTLAPELAGGLELVRRLVGAGVTVSIGHSDASAEQSHAAFDAGARAVTHVLNAHRRFAGRDPGVAGTALVRDDVVLTLIADGVHVADDALRVLYRAGRGRLAVVTDAMTAAGLGDGVHRYGPLEVHVQGARATLADGRLAGSVSTLLEGVRTLVRVGIPLAEALAAATSVPARLTRCDEVGRLRPGGRADVAILDADLQLVRVLVAGRSVLSSG